MRSVLSSPITIMALLVAITLAGFAVVRQNDLVGDAGDRESLLQAEIQRLEEENERVKRDIASFENTETIEREARERLNLKKEGEKVVVILPSDGKQPKELSDDIILQEYERRNAPAEEKKEPFGILKNLKAWINLFF
ncbi:MAG: hypothetical protein A2932_01630 [Candidatus Spechtbacteria bacterium RIFCSPLOWO2_01_FULL_46_10]|uniref:Septum formation initiator n=1 Tax=Candidatus Spechtbacteria bacterium RIFCSPLOWO2_01_FULL_46_10 TaxID=1802163 RepID=A0A1G2HHC6_9BACT|nr:MAG: hypothetical protein A2932_01630 [Candidatus Spechtbacteria bacterium RIFCSPLOWO2_01_FULL_46_10]